MARLIHNNGGDIENCSMSVAQLSPCSTSFEMAIGAIWSSVGVGHCDGVHIVGKYEAET